MLDWLTGALTRHVWQEAIVDALDRSQYAHRPCTLLMLDLDHFRTVNDVYGLPSGDETLREIVALMRTALTPDALLFRVSGDEFSSLLQDVDREVARGMAERLRLAVEQHTFPGHVVAAQLTLSIGLSTYPDDVPIYVAAYPKHVESVPGDLEQHRNILIQLCENAIHAAKNMGGNRCFAAHQIDHW